MLEFIASCKSGPAPIFAWIKWSQWTEFQEEVVWNSWVPANKEESEMFFSEIKKIIDTNS